MSNGVNPIGAVTRGATTPPPPTAIAAEVAYGVKQVTAGATEADLEARIDAAVRHAFPLLPSNGVRHQTKFTFSFGGNVITVDGKHKEAAQSRADVILYFQEKPLAVLELKRSGLALSDDDSTQGLSYARVLNPSPPLVVISNGKEVRFIETYTGNAWQPTERTQQALTALMQSAAHAATNDLKAAVSTLMATNPDVWVQALRQTTAANIAEVSGGWNDRLRPFVREFHIPRKATKEVREFIRSGSKLVIVEGAPLSGKSNVLRELAESTQEDAGMVVLFIESEGTSTILQNVADSLTRQLNWPVTKDEARTWLKNLSQSEGPQLVIVIDGIGLGLAGSRDEIVELTSATFGSRLSIVVELDDACVKAAVCNSTGRKDSAIGRRAQRVYVLPLDDAEFNSACEALWNQRIAMRNGAKSSAELRLPWVLRAIGSRLVRQPLYIDTNFAAVIPPLLSIELIELTRDAFDEETRISFRAIAEAALEDSANKKRPISLIIESTGTYVLQRKTLKKYLALEELERLTEKGYLKPLLHESGEAIFVVRVPELVASEAAWLIADKLTDRIKKSAKKAAKWLSLFAANLPLGDIIAAQAIVDAAQKEQLIPFGLISALMTSPPRKEVISEGSRVAMYMPGTGTVHMTFESGGLTTKDKRGGKHFIPLDPEDGPAFNYKDIHPWLILSHVAGIPCAIRKEDRGSEYQRLDPSLLLEIGKCQIILIRPGADPEMSLFPLYEIDDHGSFVAGTAGIIEPITLSIFKFLSAEGLNTDEWINTAVESESLVLLSRLDIALQEVANLADSSISKFAKECIEHRIRPAMARMLERK